MTEPAPRRESAGPHGGARWVSASIFTALALGWGVTYSFNRIATTKGVPFAAYAFWSLLGAALVMLSACALWRAWPRLEPAHLRAYLVTGLLSAAIPMSALAYVAPKVPAGVLAMQLTLIPACTYLTALLLKVERFDALRSAGVVLGLGGVLLILVPRASLPTPEMAAWSLLGLAMPISAGISNVVVLRVWPARAHPLPLACGFLFAAALYLLPVMLVSGEIWFFDAGLDAGGSALVGMAVVSGFFRLGFYELIRREGPVYFAMHNYLAALAGVGWAILIFADRYSGWIWGALALLMLGMFLVVRRTERAGVRRPG